MAQIVNFPEPPKSNDQKLADWVDAVSKTMLSVADALDVLERRIRKLEEPDE